MELTGNGDERTGNVVILINQFLIDRSDAIHSDINTLVNISVGDILGNVIEFPDSLGFKLLASSLFRHFVQDTLDIGPFDLHASSTPHAVIALKGYAPAFGSMTDRRV